VTAARSTVDVGDAVSRAVVDLILGSPFFGHVAGGIGRVVDPAGRWPVSLTVRGDRYVLVVAPGPFTALTRQQRVVALEHELLHAVLDHPGRALDQPADLARFGAACDLVVNQYLGAGPPLPGAFTLASLRPDPPPPHLSAEDYVAVLKRRFPAGVRRPGGCCAAGAAGGGPHPWAVPRGGLQVARAHLEPLMVESARRVGASTIGRLPGDLAVRIQALLDGADGAIDWRRALRLFASSSRKTRLQATLRRPSRRYHTFPGIRLTRGQRLAVCVDTSGSIDESQLTAFFGEIYRIWRAGAEATILEIDAAVHHTWVYRGRPPTRVTGRGGTAFEPGLAAVRQAVPPFDGCVYLTDGHGPAPSTSPGVPLLWVVTPDGSLGDHLRFGRAVQMRTPS
jgi:predicted metal-dependent peptidase